MFDDYVNNEWAKERIQDAEKRAKKALPFRPPQARPKPAQVAARLVTSVLGLLLR